MSLSTLADGQPGNGDRGQVGIGTLIVFIALVLVAAIAAGVLINTAGFLQSQSEETGQQSTAQVTDRVQAVAITGDNISNERIRTVNVTVSKAPGANDIDLLNATIQWVGPQGTFNLLNEQVSDGDRTFQVVAFKDADGSFEGDGQQLSSSDDRAIIIIEPPQFADRGIEAGEAIEIRVTTQTGSTSIIRISAPQSLAGTSSVAL